MVGEVFCQIIAQIAMSIGTNRVLPIDSADAGPRTTQRARDVASYQWFGRGSKGNCSRKEIFKKRFEAGMYVKTLGILTQCRRIKGVF